MQYDELKEHIKQAMKAHDKVRLSILRQVHGEIKNCLLYTSDAADD